MARKFKPAGANVFVPGAPSEPSSAYNASAPVTVTFTDYAAKELRRIARRCGGVGTDEGIARLAHAAVLRGLPVVEVALDESLFKEWHAGLSNDAQAHKRKPKSADDTDDDTSESVEAAAIEEQMP